MRSKLNTFEHVKDQGKVGGLVLVSSLYGEVANGIMGNG